MSNTVNPNQTNLKELWNQVADTPMGQIIESVTGPVIEAVSKLLPESGEGQIKIQKLEIHLSDFSELIKNRGTQKLVGCYHRMEYMRGYNSSPSILLNLNYDQTKEVVSTLKKKIDDSDESTRQTLTKLITENINKNENLTPEQKTELLGMLKTKAKDKTEKK